MSSWILRVPLDAYKKKTQFTAVVSKPSAHAVLLLVAAQDSTEAAFQVLKTEVDGLLKDEVDPASELYHPLSYLHVTMEALAHTPFTVSLSLDHEFLKHLLTPTQFSNLNSVELPRLVP